LAYEPRFYRGMHSEQDLHRFQVIVGETDLDIAVCRSSFCPALAEETKEFVTGQRGLILDYIGRDPVFSSTLKPYNPLPGAPDLIERMCAAAHAAGVGPMAAVAGMLAETVGRFLRQRSPEVIVENGGDIWLKTTGARNIAVYAGASPLSCRVGLRIEPGATPLGICTSSGTVGHSLSFGKADAVVVLAPSAVLADAVATAAANLVQTTGDLESAVRFACGIPGVTGALAILADRMAVFGDVSLIPV